MAGNHFSRKKKLLYSTSASIINQIVSFFTGFIMPKMYLTYYGSAVNGLTASITQFLGFISLCEMGVGAVVQSSLYKPLAAGDDIETSKIILSAELFFRKIALILVAYTIGLMIFYPILYSEQFDFLYTALLIFAIAINSFALYYFGITYRLLLNADQLAFIQLGLNSMLLIINAFFCITLMRMGAGVHAVKLTSSLIYLLQPLCLSFYVKKNYRINKKLKLTEEPIKQKWNGLAQHIATVVLNDTDVVVLTFLSTLENVSVYAVYHLVVHGVKKIIDSLTTGMQAMFGNMLAKGEEDALRATFDSFEWLMHTFVTYTFGCCGFLILPFVRVYTKNISDANYIVPLFAVLITMAQASFSIRTPYNMMTLAAGHYKQTQWSAIIEAVINISVSVVLVSKYGLVGVAIGTLSAMVYRTMYLARYISKNIIPRSISFFYKHIAVDVFVVAVMKAVTMILPGIFGLSDETYLGWIVLAIKVGLTMVLITAGVNFVFYKPLMKNGLGLIRRKFKR